MQTKEKNTIKEKIYYKIKFTLASPLAIGDGSKYTTDKDIVRDSRGTPYIPASAIAGVSRSMLLDDKDLIKKYFGKVDINDDITNSKKLESIESRLVFYDGRMSDTTKYHISVRDNVALDEYKTAINSAKFDMEILEPGVEFTTYIEQNMYSDSDENVAYKIACLWLENKIHLGGKVMRGYGSIKNVSVSEKSFKLSEDGVLKWLSFDMYDDESWSDSKDISCDDRYDSDTVSIVLKLKQNGGISIRKYTTKVSEIEGESLPDSEQLFVNIDNSEIPVIPGTSWAGAFSHRMKLLLPQCAKNDFFGCADKEKKVRSKIMFGETQLVNAKPKVMTRNAIDRFSGGTANQALFTEQTYYGGEGELQIEIRKECLTPDVAKALAATITDLNMGFLAVGGLTAIGRGLFNVTSIAIDGKSIDYEQENMYTSIVNELGGTK